ncbi:MAG: type II CAAX endopeptidase family protein [Cyanobacteria bacterium P01_A01_bin.84]
MKISFSSLSRCSAFIRIISFLVILVLFWLPYGTFIYFFIADENQKTILAMVPLAIEFFVFIPVWSSYLHKQSQVYKRYGLEFTSQNGVELLQGIAIGLISILILFILQAIFGWIIWQQSNTFLLKVVVEGAITGLGVAFAEEVVFRGWILDELQRDYSPLVVVWTGASIFAISHFIKPLPLILRTSPQFLGLLLLGFVCIWAKYSCRGRLGLPIGIHGGLVWGYYIINVGQLTKYTRSVPIWLTGVNDNPLAGIIGLLFLGLLAFWMKLRVRNQVNKF